MSTFPLVRPYYMLAKPCGSACHLRCSYCYFLDKASGRMSDALLEQFIRDYIGSQPTEEVLFIWHGGEPLLMGLDFFKRIIRLQRQYGHGRHIDNALQTNGTLLTAETAEFLREHGFLVGISIDGPQPLHDAFRRTRQGGATWDQVMRGIDLLQKYDVEWNAMATINRLNADHPLAFYRFFKEIGCRYLQFTPIVEQAPDGRMTPETVLPEQWGRFLCTLFDDWVRCDVGTVFVEHFDATLACWCGVEPGICSFAPACGLSMALQPDGEVYSCDHFVSPAYRLGNLRHTPLATLAFSPRQQIFGQAKGALLPLQCKQCTYRFACNGGCPKDRFETGPSGSRNRTHAGVNYLCRGNLAYLKHVAPAMNFMRDEWQAGRPPAGIMQAGVFPT